MATADWIKEAEEQARKYSDSIKNNNQYLVDQLLQAKNNSLSQLEQSQNSALEKLQRQQDNALYNLNAQKSDIYRTANDNAQQLNVNRLLALKDNQQAMNRAGLGNQGIVGSQVNSINNNYGTNLTNVLNQRAKDLNNLALQRENTNLGYDSSRIDLGNTYATNRLNLENEYGNNIANLQREIDNQALNQYNNIYNNYLALKQQEYQNEQNRLAQEEAKRQWQLEYDLALKNASGGSGSRSSGGSYYSGGSGGSSYNFDDNSTTSSNNTTSSSSKSLFGKLLDKAKEKLANGDSYGNSGSTMQKKDYIFSSSKEGQPSYINNTKLKSVGTMGKTFPNIPSTIKSGQNIWTDGKKYYMWEKTSNNSGRYIDITSQYNYVKKGGYGPIRW